MGWFYTPDGEPLFHALCKRRFEPPSENGSCLPTPPPQTEAHAMGFSSLASPGDLFSNARNDIGFARISRHRLWQLIQRRRDGLMAVAPPAPTVLQSTPTLAGGRIANRGAPHCQIKGFNPRAPLRAGESGAGFGARGR